MYIGCKIRIHLILKKKRSLSLSIAINQINNNLIQVCVKCFVDIASHLVNYKGHDGKSYKLTGLQ